MHNAARPRYASQSIEKKIVKKICITRKFYTVKSRYANFFRQAQKTVLFKSALWKTALAEGYLYIYFILFQFERDKKSKGNETSHSIAHTIGLEEVLSSLSSSEFHDDQVIL